MIATAAVPSAVVWSVTTRLVIAPPVMSTFTVWTAVVVDGVEAVFSREIWKMYRPGRSLVKSAVAADASVA